PRCGPAQHHVEDVLFDAWESRQARAVEHGRTPRIICLKVRSRSATHDCRTKRVGCATPNAVTANRVTPNAVTPNAVTPEISADPVDVGVTRAEGYTWTRSDRENKQRDTSRRARTQSDTHSFVSHETDRPDEERLGVRCTDAQGARRASLRR